MSAEQLAAWPTQLTKPMPATVAARMLLDSKYNPGDRPDTFDPLEVVSSSRSVVLRSLAAIAASAPTAIDGTTAVEAKVRGT